MIWALGCARDFPRTSNEGPVIGAVNSNNAMKTSPTQRSLKQLRNGGWLAVVVERWNQYARVRQDLLGFGDILAIRDNLCLMVQCCAMASRTARLNKILSEPKAQAWLGVPGHLIEIHAWRKVGPRGKRKTWKCDVTNIAKEDFNAGGGLTYGNVSMPLTESIPSSPLSGTAGTSL